MTATNNGPNTANNVTVTATYDSGATAIWASPGCVKQGASAIYVCTVGTLGYGATAQFKLVLRKAAAGSVFNNPTVSSANPDPTPSNNSASLTVTVNATPAGVPVNRYRLYNTGTGAHLYTTSLNEYNTLGAYPETWVQEGIQGKLLDNPGAFNGVTAVPYYRLYDTTHTWHHWTADANEYYTLIQYPSWNGDGVDGYILPTSATGTMPLYRLVYPDGRGLHHWTTDVNEYNVLIASYGWVGEGGAGFMIQ
jgi:hypothetical protein